MLTEFDTPERVHYAMLRGAISRITMSQCAHTWGAKAVEEFNRATELRGDLKTVSDVLMDFPGNTPWQQAQAAMGKIEWLRLELTISRRNEQAVMATLDQNRRELEHVRLMLARCATIMRANDPGNAADIFGKWILTEPNEEGFTDVDEARQTSGTQGSEQERKDS